MPRLQIQPHGLFPGISFGREPSNSTGGTFTHVAAGFPGAHVPRQESRTDGATDAGEERASASGVPTRRDLLDESVRIFVDYRCVKRAAKS